MLGCGLGQVGCRLGQLGHRSLGVVMMGPSSLAKSEHPLAAVQSDGLALEYASAPLQNDEEVVLAAVARQCACNLDPQKDSRPIGRRGKIGTHHGGPGGRPLTKPG